MNNDNDRIKELTGRARLGIGFFGVLGRCVFLGFKGGEWVTKVRKAERGGRRGTEKRAITWSFELLRVEEAFARRHS